MGSEFNAVMTLLSVSTLQALVSGGCGGLEMGIVSLVLNWQIL